MNIDPNLDEMRKRNEAKARLSSLEDAIKLDLTLFTNLVTEKGTSEDINTLNRMLERAHNRLQAAIQYWRHR